jgi:hypothetical protein
MFIPQVLRSKQQLSNQELGPIRKISGKSTRSNGIAFAHSDI